jgi:hypothetical protein
MQQGHSPWGSTDFHGWGLGEGAIMVIGDGVYRHQSLQWDDAVSSRTNIFLCLVHYCIASTLRVFGREKA